MSHDTKWEQLCRPGVKLSVTGNSVSDYQLNQAILEIQ